MEGPAGIFPRDEERSLMVWRLGGGLWDFEGSVVGRDARICAYEDQ